MFPDEAAGAQSGERCLLCRRPLPARDQCKHGLCLRCADEVDAYLAHFQLGGRHRALAIAHLWEIGGVLNRYGKAEAHHQPELLLRVPTYYGSIPEQQPLLASKEEFDSPFVPVIVRSADGVRLVLGSHDHEDLRFPDIQLERRPGGWAIFLHPVGGGDPSGYVYFLDDGRSFLVPESGLGSTAPIVLCESEDTITALHDPTKPTAETERETGPSEVCEFCGVQLEDCGDEWDGLCPECADLVSSYLDRKGLTDEDRDDAIQFLKTGPKEWNRDAEE